MPVRNDMVSWSPEEYARLCALSSQGVSATKAALTLNLEFHGNRPVRTERSVSMQRTKRKIRVAKHQPKQTGPVASEQEVEVRTSTDATEAKAVGRRIKTVEDLLAHIEADLTRFEVEKSEATKYEVATKDEATGAVVTTELHRVFVRLRPKAGPSVIEQVEAIIAGAFATRRPLVVGKRAPKAGEVLQALVIADPHVGKYAWAHETGWQDYDIGIATGLIRDAAAELLADGARRGVGRRALLLLGDYFHYDNPHGHTTKGTPLDRDGRVEKMIRAGADVLFDIIDAAADVPTDVILVPGNHDAVLTVALRQILTSHFRRDSRVRVDTGGTSRKYIEHGRCLLGMTHGDKARKRLGELMAAEAPAAWGRSVYREFHTGHLHSVAEVQTIGGVVIRTAPALCPPDGWHAQEGYVGAPRGMESYYYHAAGNLLGMTMSSPDGGKDGEKNKRLHQP